MSETIIINDENGNEIEYNDFTSRIDGSTIIYSWNGEDHDVLEISKYCVNISLDYDIESSEELISSFEELTTLLRDLTTMGVKFNLIEDGYIYFDIFTHDVAANFISKYGGHWECFGMDDWSVVMWSKTF